MIKPHITHPELTELINLVDSTLGAKLLKDKMRSLNYQTDASVRWPFVNSLKFCINEFYVNSAKQIPLDLKELQKLSAIQATLWTFKNQNRPEIYKIAEQFGGALKQANCKVSSAYLPFDSIIRCIELPEGMVFDLGAGDKSRCVYVVAFKSPPDKKAVSFDGKIISHMIEMYFPFETEGLLRFENLNLPLMDGVATLEDSLDFVYGERLKNNLQGVRREDVEFVLKSLLYINSGDPDLRHLKPLPKPKNKKAIKRWRRENLCETELILVGFDYKKERLYDKAEAFVETHLRWQPYGPNLSKVKLIWVKEHTRYYKNRVINPLNTAASA